MSDAEAVVNTIVGVMKSDCLKQIARSDQAVYDWTGLYIGTNGGWGRAHNCWDLIPVGGVLVADGCSNQSGGLFGGQFGYRWQTKFVFGVEGQGDWANLSRTRFSALFPAFTEKAKVDSIGLITAQLGWAWNSALPYFKGGAAVTGNRFNLCDTVSGLCASTSSTRWGACAALAGDKLPILVADDASSLLVVNAPSGPPFLIRPKTGAIKCRNRDETRKDEGAAG